MSRDNLQTIRRLLSQWEGGDWAAGREQFDDDCEFVMSTSAFPDAGDYKIGRDALAAWTRYVQEWDEFGFDPEELIDVGDRVVLLNRIRGRGRTSGAEVDARVGAIFTFRQGKIIRYEMVERSVALQAAGRAEP
jgi:ketosteroid isomerase-like protein